MRAKNTVACLAMALVVAGAAGCEKASVGKKDADKGAVLAEVNGEKITDTEFKREIDNLPPYLKPMTETPEGKKEMLDTMVVRELIMQQADKEGIEKSPEVKEKLDELKKRLVVEAYLKKKVEESAKLSDAELKAFYDKNQDKFKSGEQIRASHILVKSAEEAKSVQQELKGGASFEELAKKHSMDGAAQKGGDLGWFGKGAMLPEFENKAFALKEGEISGPVQTKFGYHIIKVTGKRPAGQRSFEEVKEQIREGLVPEKQQEVFKKLKEDLKKEAKIKVNEDALKALGGTPAAPAGPKPPQHP